MVRTPTIDIAQATGESRSTAIALTRTAACAICGFQRGLERSRWCQSLHPHQDGILCAAEGEWNTYAIFAENMRTARSPKGARKCIAPSGTVRRTMPTKFFFGDLMEKRSLVCLYDFENSVGLSEGVGHGRFKFVRSLQPDSLSTATQGAEFVFFARQCNQPAKSIAGLRCLG